MVEAYKCIILSKEKYNDHRETKVYKCPVCDGFHITTKPIKQELPDKYLIEVMKRQGFDRATAERYLQMGATA
jgi:hypothetical protein